MRTYLSPTVFGGLMHEHRIILRAVAAMTGELDRMAAGGRADPEYLLLAVDFIRGYADRCHHGKEEDILFRDLGEKELSAPDREAMERLVADHTWARQRTRELEAAAIRYGVGDRAAVEDVTRALGALVEFYPDHIEREDHGFFQAATRYFTAEELGSMAAECAVFERTLIHERYLGVLARLQAPQGADG